jgi:hypothetical protein
LTESLQPISLTPGKLFPSLRYVSFDPGKRTGVAAWDDPDQPPVLLNMFEEHARDAFLVRLEDHPPKVIILEPYRVWNNKFDHQNDKLYTSRVIGSIEYICRKHGIKIVEVQPSLKRTAAQWAGIKLPRGHIDDMTSAFLLGYYHLRRTNLAPSRLLQERYGK